MTSTHEVDQPEHAGRAATPFAWQGWRLGLPARWNPVKLEGDYEKGQVLFADLHRPRLGIRWERATIGKSFDAPGWAQRAMRLEVGALAADEGRPLIPSDGWTGGLLYCDPQPPGRDVWVGLSGVSGRAVQVIHHARRRDRMLADVLLPQLRDCPDDERTPWAVFALSCQTPAGWRLQSQQLNAGDLSLSFRRERDVLTVRQIAVANLALQQMPLERWLADHQRRRQKHYVPVNVSSTIDSPTCPGLQRSLARRRRFFWLKEPAELMTRVRHDIARNRLVITESNCPQLLPEIESSVGWAN